MLRLGADYALADGNGKAEGQGSSGRSPPVTLLRGRGPDNFLRIVPKSQGKGNLHYA
ncbi:MAG TPA: hypothetical protein V6D02_04150 [Candidatus Obscuribacterales bacterium]